MQNEELTKWPYAPDLRGRALYFAKSYDRLRHEADEMIAHEIGIIEGALLDIEPEYRAGILENVCRGVPMWRLDGATERTWSRKRRVFLAGIVERAGWAEPASEWRSY